MATKKKIKTNTEEKKTELEFAPCPFCGENNKIKLKVDAWLTDTGENFPKYYVMCEYCGCKTSRFLKDDAIAHWNSRSEPMKIYDTRTA